MASSRPPTDSRDAQRSLARVIASFALVGLLAAGAGYVLGLYLTGAIGQATPPPVDAVEPGDAGEPVTAGAGEGSPPGTDAGAAGGAEDSPAEGGAEAAGETAALPAGGDQAGDEALEERVDSDPEDPETPDEPVPVVPVVIEPATVYVLQAGLFSDRANAGAALDQVSEAGLEAAVVAADGYRLWAGLFATIADGRSLEEQWRDTGMEVFLSERAWQGEARLVLPEGRDTLSRHLGAVAVRVRAAAAAAAQGMPGDAGSLQAAAGELETLAGTLGDGEAGRIAGELAEIYRDLAGLVDGSSRSAGGGDKAAWARLAARVEALLGSLP